MPRKKRVPIWGLRGDNVYFNTQVTCLMDELALEDVIQFVEIAEWLEISCQERVMFFKNQLKRYYAEESFAFYVESQIPSGKEVKISYRIYCPLYLLDIGLLRNFVDEALKHGCERDAEILIYNRDNPYPLNFASIMQVDVRIE